MMCLSSTFLLEVDTCSHFYTHFHISYTYVHNNTDTNVQERFQTFGDLAAIAAAAGMVTTIYFHSPVHIGF